MKVRTLVLVLLFGLYARPILAAPILSIQPVMSSVQLNETFLVDIIVGEATDLFAFQFNLGFDAGVLLANGILEGGFLPTGGGTLFIPGTIDNSAGDIAFTADTLLGPVRGVNGNGIVARVSFTSRSFGTSGLSLSNAVFLNSSLATSVPVLENGSVHVVPEPASLLLVATGLSTAWLKRRKSL